MDSRAGASNKPRALGLELGEVSIELQWSPLYARPPNPTLSFTCSYIYLLQ